MNVFIVFPPCAGGNHLRNMILYSTDFFGVDYHDSIQAQYLDNRKDVHAEDIGHEYFQRNLTAYKLHQTVINPRKNHLFYGHFAEFCSHKDLIKTMQDVKILLLSPETDRCKCILTQRVADINDNHISGYFAEEQVFLYEWNVYKELFKIRKNNIMNISISELFSENITDAMNRVSHLIGASLTNSYNIIHKLWLNKNQQYVHKEF